VIALQRLLEQVPEVARDLRLNLTAVLEADSLTSAQRWGVAVASAHAAEAPVLAQALVEGARAAGVGEPALEDARAAAAIMAMNTVYYRFRHMIGKPSYGEKPARLRMHRLGKPATTKADLELMSLAVAAIHGCELCVRAHEDVIVKAGLSEDQVHDAVRIAAAVRGVSQALALGAPAAAPLPG
jgi:alkyl hydroperoxide reductase subunit D